MEICACSDTSVYQHIHINHPSHRRDWVPKKSARVDLKVVPRDSCATLSITIKNIEEDDIDVVFSVNVYTDQRDPMKNTLIEFIVVTFVLEQQQSKYYSLLELFFIWILYFSLSMLSFILFLCECEDEFECI